MSTIVMGAWQRRRTRTLRRVLLVLLLMPGLSAAIVALGVATLTVVGSWPPVDRLLRALFALAAWAVSP